MIKKIAIPVALAFAFTTLTCTLHRSAAADRAAPVVDNQLNATLWMQTAAEHDAITLQTFRAARVALDRALLDPRWSASLEQRKMGHFADLPPAIVLDIDETVLDNSYYQARLIRNQDHFTPSSWNTWVQEAAATPIPGALGFTRYAAGRGVEVIYITNRNAAAEAATRRNLQARGFPLAKDFDALLTRAEHKAWKSADKTPRRMAVARKFRILLLLGDNFGDFIGGVRVAPAARQALFAAHHKEWGSHWFMLPNPTYGSWEGALFGFDYRLDTAARLREKLAHLKPQP